MARNVILFARARFSSGRKFLFKWKHCIKLILPLILLRHCIVLVMVKDPNMVDLISKLTIRVLVPGPLVSGSVFHQILF